MYTEVYMTIKFSLSARVISILVLVALLVLPASGALAAGNGAQSFTQTFHNATDTFQQLIPCIGPDAAGANGTITITYNGVMHFTVNEAGDFWGTGTETGTAVAVPDDPSLPTYTGHFTTWFGVSENNRNYVESQTFTVHATGTDGSSITFHETMHLTYNGNGELVVSFDKAMCG